MKKPTKKRTPLNSNSASELRKKKFAQLSQRGKKQAQQKKTEVRKVKQRIAHLQPGDEAPDGTIYLGCGELKNKQGKLLGVFNFYAAPKDVLNKYDMREQIDYEDSLDHIASLKNYYGHDGGYYETEEDLYREIEEGRYKGEWFIPPMEVFEKYLYFQQNKGELPEGFKPGKWNNSHTPYYWTSTTRTEGAYMYCLGIENGKPWERQRKRARMSLRCVRAEPRK